MRAKKLTVLDAFTIGAVRLWLPQL